MSSTRILLLALCALPVLGSCRRDLSSKPPVHLVQNMDFQEKYKAQSESAFFADGRTMRLPVEGTVPQRQQHDAVDPLRQHSRDDATAALYVYKNGETFVTKNPLAKSQEVLALGQKAYEINCSMCHGRNGRGGGIVATRLPVRPPSFVKPASDDLPDTRNEWDRISKLGDGEIFSIMTEGKGTMSSYAHQVSPRERWAIVHYIRALQLRAQN